MIKNLEDILMENSGKWISIYYALRETPLIDPITGILKEFNEEYIEIENELRNFLNLKAITIIRISVRSKKGE